MQYEIERKIETDEMQVNDKNDLIQIVRKWVQIDNQLRAIAKAQKQLREEKKRQNTQMIAVMKENNIDNLDLKDGQIQYKTHNKRETLSQKKLFDILKSHPGLNENQVDELNTFVYNSRKITQVETIERRVLDES